MPNREQLQSLLGQARPILFRPEMVRALLEGRKSQTRRPAWREGFTYDDEPASEEMENWELLGWDCRPAGGRWEIRKPTAAQRIEVGDRLWVREAFNNQPVQWHGGPTSLTYRADQDEASLKVAAQHGIRWRSSLHMPRAASRLTLEVTAVRIERLQDISEADAEAEGCIKLKATGRAVEHRGAQYAGLTWPSCRAWYQDLYETIHGDGAWDANPEVVAITFTVHKMNVDALLSALTSESQPKQETQSTEEGT